MQIDSMHRECLLCHPQQHPIFPHGFCHGWLCGARAPAYMCKYEVVYLKRFQRDPLIKESAGSNQQALSDVGMFSNHRSDAERAEHVL